MSRMSRIFTQFLQPPFLTRQRVRLAYTVAIATDALQMMLGPLGWAFADEILDGVAMLLTWKLIGFHPLLLPTLILEFVPVADMLPTWTACVALVVTIRKRQQANRTPPEGPGRIIDI